MVQLETNGAREQAKAQLENIREMVKALQNEDNEDAEEAIREDPLEVSVRTGWHSPGDNAEPDEYCILLCTGGPAVQLTGNLSHNEPEDVHLEYQDWYKPWARYPLDRDEAADCLRYARQFFFG